MQNAKNAMVSMREEVNMQANNYQSHVEAARVAELEAAQAAAQAALMAEMELLRRQKHGAEQQARDLEDQASLESTPLAISLGFERLPQQHTVPVQVNLSIQS